VRAHWAFAELDDGGMGLNFRTLRDVLRELVRDRFDHRHLNDIAPFDSRPPTAENLAREIFRIVASGFDAGPRGRLARIEVWEGPESCVAYTED
jgi:6-pyruvoyltetrahydropterin/6-carboxytetrahydropterin synthase